MKVFRAALDEVFHQTKGYPYFLQEWGYVAWNLATTSPITLQVVCDAKNKVIPRLDENFFVCVMTGWHQAKRFFLRATAELGSGAHRSGDIAEILNVKVTRLGPPSAGLGRR